MSASRHLSAAVELEVEGAVREPPAARPDRVYVRLERRGGMQLLLWGMEHQGLRSEVVESLVDARVPTGGRAAASRGIERDLRRGVGLPR
jgi:hypothetical protein